MRCQGKKFSRTAFLRFEVRATKPHKPITTHARVAAGPLPINLDLILLLADKANDDSNIFSRGTTAVALRKRSAYRYNQITQL
jgi:hypothetical protein